LDSPQVISFGAPPVRWWQAYHSKTLDALVEEGLAHNADIASATSSLLGAREALSAQVGSSELPYASLSGELAHERSIGLPDFGPPTSIYKLYAGVINVGYDLDLFGGIRRANEASRAQVEMQALELRAARQVLAGNIVMTAIRAAALHEEIQATERLVELARTAEALTRQRYALGAAPHRDVLDALRAKETAAAALSPLRTQWAHDRHALAVLLGRTPEQAPEDLPFASLTLPSDLPISVPSELVHTRPDILASEASLHAANAKLGLATANLYPQISLTGTYGSESFTRGEFLRSPTTVWGLAAGVTQPLFAGGSLRARQRQAQDDLESARERYRSAVLRAFQNVADALRTLEEDAHLESERKGAEGAARNFFEETERRYRLGSETILAVVNSEQTWQEERTNQIDSASARLLDTAALFEAIGAPEE
jgi:NodT family efflux transporter outer membrane factor (OMF) lipoprotein